MGLPGIIALGNQRGGRYFQRRQDPEMAWKTNFTYFIYFCRPGLAFMAISRDSVFSMVFAVL